MSTAQAPEVHRRHASLGELAADLIPAQGCVHWNASYRISIRASGFVLRRALSSAFPGAHETTGDAVSIYVPPRTRRCSSGGHMTLQGRRESRTLEAHEGDHRDNPHTAPRAVASAAFFGAMTALPNRTKAPCPALD